MTGLYSSVSAETTVNEGLAEVQGSQPTHTVDTVECRLPEGHFGSMNLEFVFWVIVLREIFHRRYSEISRSFSVKKKVTAKSLFFVLGFFLLLPKHSTQRK